MNYPELASELLSLRASLDHLPFGIELSEMSGGEYFALSLLHANPSPIHPSDLSRAMNVSTARIAALLKHLEEKGWIERNPDKEDERKVSVTLTEKGKTLIAEKRRKILSRLCRILEALGPNDAFEYIRLQKKLISAAKE